MRARAWSGTTSTPTPRLAASPGTTNVQILDGGFDKWTREGRPTSTDVPTYPATQFHANPVPAVYCSLEDAKASIGRPGTIFWDTRTDAEYDGTAATTPQSPPRPGHLPGAVHLDWTELLDSESKTLRPAAELSQLLSAKGIRPESEIDCY